jgi:hypothetical protein
VEDNLYVVSDKNVYMAVEGSASDTSSLDSAPLRWVDDRSVAGGPKPPPPVSVRLHDSFDLTAAISPDSASGSVDSRNHRAHESAPAPPPPVSDRLTQQFDLAIAESSESEAGDSMAQLRAQPREMQALLAENDEAVARQRWDRPSADVGGWPQPLRQRGMADISSPGSADVRPRIARQSSKEVKSYRQVRHSVQCHSCTLLPWPAAW